MSLALERAGSARKVGLLSLVGLVLLPLLIAGGFVFATWDSTDRLDHVDAAIVNNDEPIKIGDQLVPLGRQLAGGLIASENATEGAEATQNYDWILSDKDDAAEGLQSGRYAVVVTIPENFSEAATSYSKDDPSQAVQATVKVEVANTTAVVDPALSQAIVAAATGALNSQLTKTYLENIYVGFNDLSKQFKTVADASGDLADGSTKLSTGIDGASKGTTDLSTGLGQLSTGAGKFATGVGEFSKGTTSLSDGLGQLAEGTKSLPTQTKQLSDGVKGVSDGAGKLAEGTGKLDDGAAELATGTKKLSDGVDGLAAGAKQLSTGAKQLNQGMPALKTGSTQLAEGVAGLAGGLQLYQGAMQQLPQQITCKAVGIVDPLMCAGFEAGVKAASGAAADGLSAPGPQQAPSLLQGAKQLSQGATSLAQGINGTKKQPGVADGVAGIATGAKQLSDGAKSLADGAEGLQNGTSEFAKGVTQLDTGAGDLAAGAKKLAKGAKQFSDAMPALSKGISGAADGASKLATGASQLSVGATDLATGAKGAADGSDKLAKGMVKLADGGSALALGAGQLSDGLAKGADQVPTYTESERENLAEVVTAPVGSGDEEATVFSDVSAAAFIAAVALWLGGLATYLVVRAVSSRTLTSLRPSWLLAAQGLLPGMAISVIPAIGLSVIMKQLLELDGGQFARILGLCLLAGLTFAAINHALVAALGGVGRFLSIAFVTMAAAGGLLSAVPEFFTAVRPLLPLTPALEGIKAIAGAGSGTGSAVGGLLLWLVGAMVVSVLAIARKRMITADQLG